MPPNLHETTLSVTSTQHARPRATHAGRTFIARFAALLGVATLLAATPPASAQDEDDFGGSGVDGSDGFDEPPPTVTMTNPSASGTPTPADFSGTLQIVRGPPVAGSGKPGGGPEIFPEASRVFMSVRDTDPVPIETARRGGHWMCSSGQCMTSSGDPGESRIGNMMLRSIKLQTPTLPLPLTIWGRLNDQGQRVLDFDPVLLSRRDYGHVCAYKPIDPDDLKGNRPVEKAPVCRDTPPRPPQPDSAEIILGMQWPKQSDMADFRYLAIVDSCGNARVQPFQRTFTVPVVEVASGGCGNADGKVLRVFPSGGWLRVTAFNLDAPAAGTVVSATYRVSIPALENLVESNPARLLFPDPQYEDLQVDCGPTSAKGPSGPAGLPSPMMAPPGARPPGAPPPGAAPPGAKPPPAAAPDAKPPAGAQGRTPPQPGLPTPAKPPAATDKRSLSGAVGVKVGAGDKPTPSPIAPKPSPMAPPKGRPPMGKAAPSGPGPQPLAHGSLVIAPEPLRQGVCRIRLKGQAKNRLVAPLALYVSLTRTDRTSNGAPIELLHEHTWIVTPRSAEFQLPPLSENFDGDSRLRLAVYSDPRSEDGKVVLFSDAPRVAASLRAGDASAPESARRLIGSATIHSVPLCGETNFETLETAGSCLRAYLTIPAMLATLQITRAPWLERPLVTRTVLSAVGVAIAFDAYNPVRRRAFPIAGQLGGSIQQLGDGRVGMLGYLGVAPTIPVLGEGGNTTSFGFLAGAGLSYISNETGADEGFKPAAFLSIVVQVGQATPGISGSGSASGSFGFGGQ